MTREEWLRAAVELYRPYLHSELSPRELGPVEVSVGWGFRTPRKRRAECWAREASGGRANQIFVSPAFSQAAIVLTDLAHELIHAIDNCKHGHGPQFANMARKIGLEPSVKLGWESTSAGPALIEVVEGIIEELGPYPHEAIIIEFNPTKKRKTYMIKASCNECGYTVRSTRQWLDRGVPSCPDAGCDNYGETLDVHS